MKINRHGRAKVLTQSEIQLIFSHGLENDRDRKLKYDICSNFIQFIELFYTEIFFSHNE
ncbi:hypothetical protein [Nostoc sphaeroides]|uniref:Site-specific integrase n=1 Tax=Nostoc sphaeroides CCNUC1 TaxID=2653204 RepID=A0A5P8VR06_9NOSO|nr:hypothetical protein [Nostoc sphaeroides]QFS42711.1 site-specific integrase [Nostoc sphaeroides CCNUC1]